MSTRNRDKIKQLEHELGRYEKKVGDLMKVNAQLAKRARGVAEISIATDALLAQVAIAYGEDAVDPDTGAVIANADAAEVRRRETYRKYEVHARRVAKTTSSASGCGMILRTASGIAGNAPESEHERSEYEKCEMTPPEDKNAQSASQGDLREAHDGADIG